MTNACSLGLSIGQADSIFFQNNGCRFWGRCPVLLILQFEPTSQGQIHLGEAAENTGQATITAQGGCFWISDILLSACLGL